MNDETTQYFSRLLYINWVSVNAILQFMSRVMQYRNFMVLLAWIIRLVVQFAIKLKMINEVSNHKLLPGYITYL